MGWIFSIQALINNEHDYAHNPHFLLYAYIGILNLLLNKKNFEYNIINSETLINIDRIYSEDTFIVIMSKKYLNSYEINKQRVFDIKTYLPFFYKYGLIHSGILTNMIYPSTSFNEIKSKNFNIVELSKDLLEESYIFELFYDITKIHIHQLVRFHLLYQVIELLISKIFSYELSNYLEDFRNSKKFFETREKVNDIAGEKNRINLLFQKYSTDINYFVKLNLRDKCNLILD